MDADELNETAAVMQCTDGEVATSSLWLGGARIIAGKLVFENFTRVEVERRGGQNSNSRKLQIGFDCVTLTCGVEAARYLESTARQVLY